jgi:hypothetical protein
VSVPWVPLLIGWAALIALLIPMVELAAVAYIDTLAGDGDTPKRATA